MFFSADANWGWTYRFLYCLWNVQQPLDIQAALLQEAQAMVTGQSHVFFSHPLEFSLSLGQPNRTGSWKTEAGGQRPGSNMCRLYWWVLLVEVLLDSSSFASQHRRKSHSLASWTDCSWLKGTSIHTQAVSFTLISKHEEQMASHPELSTLKSHPRPPGTQNFN